MEIGKAGLKEWKGDFDVMVRLKTDKCDDKVFPLTRQ